MFLIKKIMTMTKQFCLNDRIFVSYRNFTTKHIKIVKNSRFLFKIPGFSRLKKSQILGFLRFPGIVANPMIFLT